jgi:hypothetical protein
MGQANTKSSKSSLSIRLSKSAAHKLEKSVEHDKKLLA